MKGVRSAYKGRPLRISRAGAKNQRGTGKLPVGYVLSPCLLLGFSHFVPRSIADMLFDD